LEDEDYDDDWDMLVDDGPQNGKKDAKKVSAAVEPQINKL